MTDEQAIKLVKWIVLTTERLNSMQAQLDRIESAMLKREDLHPSVQKPHSIEEWEQLMAGENAATQRRKSLKRAGEQREGGE